MGKEKTNNMPPIFVFGVQRSGTTLLRLLLDSHSEIAIPHESFVMVHYYENLKDYNNLEQIEDMENIAQDILHDKGFRDWAPPVRIEELDLNSCVNYPDLINMIFSCYAHKCGKNIWGDKTPTYVQDMNILNELFPNARFINLIRDGRDVALSLERQTWGPTGYISALKYWRETVFWTRKMGGLLPKDRYLEVKYEDLVLNTQGSVMKILNFLDLSYEKGLLEQYFQNLGKKIPDSAKKYHANVFRPIDKGLVHSWKSKLSEVDEALSYQIAGNLIEELGYPIRELKIQSWRLKLRRIYHAIKKAMEWRRAAYKKYSKNNNFHQN